MISLADILAHKKIVKEDTTKQYITQDLKTKARTYALLVEFIDTKLSQYDYKCFVNHSVHNCVLINIVSSNNALIATLNMSKKGLAKECKDILLFEKVIDSHTEVKVVPKLV